VEFRRASEEDRERFSYGQCMWFALATHQRMGWSLEVTLDDAGWIAHAWTRMPDGRTFDVAGPDGAEDFISDPGAIRAVSVEELIGLTQGSCDTEAVAQAHRVLEAMLPTPVRRPGF
jgi:hypothetical protein